MFNSSNMYLHGFLYDKFTSYLISRSPEGVTLTHSARTPPAVHQGITIWVDEIEFEKK